jgi:peptide deformylase
VGRVTGYALRFFGDPVLKQPARAVEEITPDLIPLVHGMYATMDEAEGVGLAAPQVGVRKRIFTYDLHDGDGPAVVINPEIVEIDGEILREEGCLSVPGFRFEIVRAQRVVMRGLDLDGREVVVDDDDHMAHIIQHEIDHLDGVLLLDRLEPDARREAMRAIRMQELPAGADLGR